MLKTVQCKALLIGVSLALLLTYFVDKAAEAILIFPEVDLSKVEPMYLVLSGYFMKYNILRIILCGAMPGYVAARLSKTNKILIGFLAVLASQAIYVYFHDFNFIRKHEITLAIPLLLTLMAATLGALIAKTLEAKKTAI